MFIKYSHSNVPIKGVLISEREGVMYKIRRMLVFLLMISLCIPTLNSLAWDGGDHDQLVQTATSGTTLSAYHKMIMRKAVRVADDSTYDATTIYIGLHAGGMSGTSANGSSKNYVLSLQFLYHAAYLLKNNPNTNYETLITRAANNVKTKTGSTVDANLVQAAKLVSNDEFNFYETKYNNKALYPQNTNIERSYKVLGFALHLAGDIYAHRTMVPMASINNTVSQTVSSPITSNVYNLNHFNTASTSPCTNALIKETAFNKNSTADKCTNLEWNCLKHGIGTLYVIEFGDIKWFTKQRTYGATYYEDNSKFYSSRYSVAADYTTKYIINKFIANADYLDNKVLLPGENGRNYTMKLNNLKAFYQATGFTWNSTWDNYSVTLR